MLVQEEYLNFLSPNLPDGFIEKARKELNETEENKISSLGELKALLKNDDMLSSIDFHDDHLRQFLRQSKYEVSRAHSHLRSFISFRTKHPELFTAVDFEEVSKNSSYQYCTPLPLRCPDGCTITVLENGKWDPSEIAFEDLMRLTIIMYHQSLRNPVSQVCGYKMIIDWKNTSMSHLKYFTPHNLYLMYQAYLTCTPVRYKEIHMVNESLVMKVVWSIFRPFLNEKMTSRVIFHSSPEDLLKYFPRDVLPVQYGGDLTDYYMTDWMKVANEEQKAGSLAGQADIM